MLPAGDTLRRWGRDFESSRAEDGTTEGMLPGTFRAFMGHSIIVIGLPFREQPDSSHGRQNERMRVIVVTATTVGKG